MTYKKQVTISSSVGAFARAERVQKMSLRQVRKAFAPQKTLGVTEDEYMACDSALNDSGFYSLLQHSINLGQMPLGQFMGYGALQQLAQNSLLRTCISIPCKDMLKGEIKFTVDRRDYNETQELKDPTEIEDENAETIGKIDQSFKKYDLKKVLLKALELDGYEGGAFIFIDTGARGDELKLPLNISNKSEELRPERPLSFKVIDPINVFAGVYNSSDPLENNYFEPETWGVLGTQVHKSRLIRIVSNEVPLLLKPNYNFLGIPQAQLLWDYVMHFNQNRESCNRLLNKFSLLVFKSNLNDILNGGLSDDLDRRMDYLSEKRNNDSTLLIDKESEDIVNITTPISGVTDIVKQSLEMLAVASHIPAVILFGQSPSGFNATGESDLNNYANLIETKKEELLRPILNTIIECIKIHDTECKDPINFDFVYFDTSKQLLEEQRQKMEAEKLATYLQAGVLGVEEVRQKLANDPNSGLSYIDATDVPQNNLADDFGEGEESADQENQELANLIQS